MGLRNRLKIRGEGYQERASEDKSEREFEKARRRLHLPHDPAEEKGLSLNAHTIAAELTGTYGVIKATKILGRVKSRLKTYPAHTFLSEEDMRRIIDEETHAVVDGESR
jgi:hypothetical protein